VDYREGTGHKKARVETLDKSGDRDYYVGLGEFSGGEETNISLISESTG
jgi:hypothetical protein